MAYEMFSELTYNLFRNRPGRAGPGPILGGDQKHATACENPQEQGTPHGRMTVPCRQCYTCRRKVVRTKQFQALAEFRYPLVRYSQYDLDSVHFFTLTYKTAPMTNPQPVKLGHSINEETGEYEIFKGPFMDQYRDARREPRIYVSATSGTPKWTATRQELTADELVREHRDYLTGRLGWTSQDVRDYESGNFPAVETLVRKDVTDYLKRVRTNYRRKKPNANNLRYIVSGEYGGLLGRPHYHLGLWGLPLEYLPLLYEAWPHGHIDPPLWEAQTQKASVMEAGNAATYQSKDLCKGAAENKGNPRVYIRQRPFVQGSTKPPLGERFYPIWKEQQVDRPLSNWMGQFQYEQPPLSPEQLEEKKLLKLRELRGIAILDNERFPTPDRWRKNVLVDYGLGRWVECETADGVENRKFEASQTWQQNSESYIKARSTAQSRIEQDPKLSKAKEKHHDRLRKKHEDADQRERVALERKRSRLRSQGKI